MVLCGEVNISSKQSVRYLGVDLDQLLDGSKIADNILKKSNSRLTFLKRQANCLNFMSRKLLASVLIRCHFEYEYYMNIIWYNGLTKLLQINKLTKITNYAKQGYPVISRSAPEVTSWSFGI